MNQKTISDALRVGRIMLTGADASRLEAFSGNALYYGRGMPTMNKYKTVKEVCALTGLTRKHLYYFHHEKVVQAAAYANYSVEGNDGYKLYDDASVDKLLQIALYYQLGLKRDEIRDIMLEPDYDSNLVLCTLLSIEQEKRVHIERNIAALEYLTLAGTKDGLTGALRGISLDDLGRTLLGIRDVPPAGAESRPGRQVPSDALAEELKTLLLEFAALDKSVLRQPEGSASIGRIFDLGHRQLGSACCPFLLGLFLSALGEGTIAREISVLLTPDHGRAVIDYILAHPELYEERLSGTEDGIL